jgi:hypothetical protein
MGLIVGLGAVTIFFLVLRLRQVIFSRFKALKPYLGENRSDYCNGEHAWETWVVFFGRNFALTVGLILLLLLDLSQTEGSTLNKSYRLVDLAESSFVEQSVMISSVAAYLAAAVLKDFVLANATLSSRIIAVVFGICITCMIGISGKEMYFH